MTEQEVIDQFVANNQNAQALFAWLAKIATGTASEDATVTLVGGLSYTVPTEAKRKAALDAQFNTQKLNFYRDFGGAMSEVITRNAAGQMTQVVATFASGWSMTQTFTRATVGTNAGRIASIAFTIKDELGVTQQSGTRTLSYSNGLLASIA